MRKLPTILMALGALVTSVTAIAQIATEPLLTRSPPVKPNFLFSIDDSGSMGWSVIYSKKTRQLVTSDKGELKGELLINYFNAATQPECPDTAVVNKSSINNTLHYNPAIRYLRARNNQGDLQANAPVSNASVVTVYRPVPGFNPDNATTLTALCTTANYDKIEVTGTTFKLNGTNAAVNPFGVKSTFPNRKDCITAASNYCTLAEERQNIANWLAFHSKRVLAAKTGIGEAFSRVPTTFRLTWNSINKSAVADIPVIKDYDLAKPDFYTWLNGVTPSGGTPLRQALDRAGQYYSSSTNTGPWANKPWATGGNSEGEARTDHLSCRRSFTMLITDGEWKDATSDTAASRLDVDSKTGPQIIHANGTTKYQYKPGAVEGVDDARSVGKRDSKGNGTTFDDTLADVAMYYWVNDLRTGTYALSNNVTNGAASEGAFWQNMTTYAAAFGPTGVLSKTQVEAAKRGKENWLVSRPGNENQETVDDLIHATHNSGGQFLEVNDAESFATQLSAAIGGIADLQYSQAGVAASAVVLTADTKKFIPTFNSASWWGNLKMLNLQANGNEQGLAWEVISTVNGKPTGVTTIPSPTTREIYTFVTSTPNKKIIPFTKTALDVNGLIASSAAANTTTLMNNSTTASLVDYIRGNRSNEGPSAVDNFRKREAILGDIVNSTPVFVKNVITTDYSNLPTTIAGAGTSWTTYKAAKTAYKEGALFVGANDGMLHGFREGSAGNTPGAEIFAFIPRGVLGNLHRLGAIPFVHRYFVDGPLAQSEAYINVEGITNSTYSTRWTNVLMGSTGAGGKSVFAIDVTKPLQMSERSVMWEVNSSMTGFANLGNVLNEIETGVLNDGSWVAVFNNGPYGASGKASLFIVNLSTGALIKEIGTNDTVGNGLGGVRLVRNNQGVIQGAYAGDLKGNMWKFTLIGANSTWKSEKLFTTNNGLGGTTTFQPITAAPAVITRSDNLTGTMVVFGTGKLFDDADQSNTSRQSGYGLWDNVGFGPAINTIADRAPLVSISVVETTSTVAVGTSTNQTTPTRLFNTKASRTVDWNTDRGWYIDYTLADGQRTIYPAEPLDNLIRLDTISPRLNQKACDTSATSGFNFLINPLTGLCNQYATLDTNNDGLFNDKDATDCVYSTEADGRDVALLKAPGTEVNTQYSIQDSNGQLTVTTRNCGDSRYAKLFPSVCSKTAVDKYRRDWRQLFMRK
jgi:type IV pilus assembly protein PilY1